MNEKVILCNDSNNYLESNAIETFYEVCENESKTGHINNTKKIEKLFPLKEVEFELELLKMINESIYGSNIDITNQIIIQNSESRMKNLRSIINLNFEVDETSGRDFDIQRNCTISLIYVLNNIFSCNYQSPGNKSADTCFSLLEECISNYLSGRAGELLIESLMDILLPEKCTNIFERLNFDLKIENYYILSAMLYFCIVNMNLRSMDSCKSNNKYNNTNYNTGNSMLLPTSRIISEVEDSWLFNYIGNNINKFFKEVNLFETSIYKVKNINIFDFKYVPQIIKRLIQYLKIETHYFNDSHFKSTIMTINDKINNPFSGDHSQLLFYVGRILEICFASSKECFVSTFLECDGPLFLIPYIHYSSIQDFLLRFFGVVCVIKTETHLNRSYSSIDSGHSDDDGGPILSKTKEQNIREQFQDLGVSEIIYNWSVENNFIQSLIYPISYKSSSNNPNNSEKLFKGDFSFNTQVLSGVIEFISRLVEYLRPEQCGLPINMMSIGLLWLVYSGENNNCFNSLNPRCGPNFDTNSILSYETAYLLSKGETGYKSGINGNDEMSNRASNTENIKLGFNYSKQIIIQVETEKGSCDHFTDSSYKLDKVKFVEKSFEVVRHHLEKSLQLINIIFIESSLIQYICEFVILNHEFNSERDKIVKLRLLNLLEEIIVLTFSTDNIIGCFRHEIIDVLRPYLFKFCDLILSKYIHICEYSGEIGNLVSHLTIVKLILLYDDKRELINNLPYEFWDWLLNLFIRKRENSFIAIQCRTIFELGIQFGSFITLKNLFYNIRLVERLSRFIFDGKDLNGVVIEDTQSLKNKRIFGPIKDFFVVLGQFYDSLLETVNICENETYLNIKIEFLREIIASQFSEYIEEGELKNVVSNLMSSGINNSRFHLYDSLHSNPFSLLTSEGRRIYCLLSALSCRTRYSKNIKHYLYSNEENILRGITSDEKDSHSFCCNSREAENSVSSNPVLNNPLGPQEELNSKKTLIHNLIIKLVFVEQFQLLGCCEECECPRWSFFNILMSIKKEKEYSSIISTMPILPLEESRRIRESRKRQTKLYPVRKK
ncbi:hypothetical protein RS030_111743 [Cryptosporidium xiaoi]|uniref:FPL domain-containing protein n=1 Tax=Cryptosporidium xiaoi TaxID=659607 RepID=A0AAV9Y2J7_9CRYT